jgi:hypothetical protein
MDNWIFPHLFQTLVNPIHQPLDFVLHEPASLL